MPRSILVTGAASGIGAALAEALLARGKRVIASARRPDQLEDLVAKGATPLAMDVSDDASTAQAFASLEDCDAVIHCAAIAPVGLVETTPPDRVAEVINTNTLGALRVLQHSLPLLRKAEPGRLLLLSSLWGEVSGPLVSSYAASKHALEALADAARRETAGQGVFISVIQPGVVKTPMYFQQLDELERFYDQIPSEEQGRYRHVIDAHRKLVATAEKAAITPEECIAVILRCLDAKRPLPRYRAGRDAKVMTTLGRVLSDRGLDRLFARLYSK